MNNKVLETIVSKLFNFGTEAEVQETLYNKTDEGLQLKEGIDNIILGRITTKLNEKDKKIDALKDELTKKFDEGAKDREGKLYSKIEKQLEDRFEYKSEKETFEDKLLDIIDHEKSKSGIKTGKLTDDDIKKTAPYIAVERELNKLKEVQKQLDTVTQEFDTFKKHQDRTQKFGVLKTRVETYLDKIHAVLPTDDEKKKNVINLFMKEFEQYEDMQIDKDDVVLINKDGKRYEDVYGNPIKLEQVVKEKADLYFDFLKQPPRSGAGNNTQNNGGMLNTPTMTLPKTQEEFNKTLETLTGKEKVDYYSLGVKQGLAEELKGL